MSDSGISSEAVQRFFLWKAVSSEDTADHFLAQATVKALLSTVPRRRRTRSDVQRYVQVLSGIPLERTTVLTICFCVVLSPAASVSSTFLSRVSFLT